MKLSPRTPEIGFLHRKLPTGELYFVANTSNEDKHVTAQFRDRAAHAEMWDGFSGEISGIPNPENIQLDLAPYESRLIFFSDAAKPAAPQPERHEVLQADLSHDWKVSFPSASLSIDMSQLSSWSDDARTKFFSGQVNYE